MIFDGTEKRKENLRHERKRLFEIIKLVKVENNNYKLKNKQNKNCEKQKL